MNDSGTFPSDTGVYGQVSDGPWWIRYKDIHGEHEIGYLTVTPKPCDRTVEEVFAFNRDIVNEDKDVLWKIGVHYIAEGGPPTTPTGYTKEYKRILQMPGPLPRQPVDSADYDYDFFDLIGKPDQAGANWIFMGIRAIHRQDPTHRYTFQAHWNAGKQALKTVPSRVEQLTVKLFNSHVWRLESDGPPPSTCTSAG